MAKLMDLSSTTLGEKQRDSSWDFASADTKEFTHCFHSYPAMMIPQVARKLLKLYGKESTTLVDPFMGSGSVLVEGEIHPTIGKMYGLDINPLTMLIANVKVTPIKPEKLEAEFASLMENVKSKKNLDLGFYNLNNINFWFKQNVISDLSKLKSAIDEIENKNIKNFFLTCFSQTTRKVSNTRQGEFKLYRIEEKKLEEHAPNVFGIFEAIVSKNIKGMTAYYSNIKLLDKDIKVNTFKEDSRLKTSIPSDSCDILVTSPPYGDSRTTVAYGQFSRLSSQLLGYPYEEIRKVDQLGLGGKPIPINDSLQSDHLKESLDKISAIDNLRALDVFSFYYDFDKCIDEINRIMKTGAYLCFVVGNRTVKGIQIPTDDIITELFVARGNYEHIKTYIRKIPNKKMPKANSPTNVKGQTSSTMNEEYIVILKKSV